MPRIYSPTIYNIDSTINFGKHSGRTLFDVINTYPSYIQWCLDNVAWFRLDEKALDILDLQLLIYSEESTFQFDLFLLN